MSDATAVSGGVRQWMRKLSLIVAGGDNKGIELSNLQVRFTITAAIVANSPATLAARIYNLNKTTEARILGMNPVEAGFSVAAPSGSKDPAHPSPSQDQLSVGQVLLRAGYEGNFGIIFKGDLMQVRRGRETPADTYLDIFAADGDTSHVWGMVNVSLAAGYTHGDVLRHLRTSYASYGVNVNDLPNELPKPAAPRGKVLFGHARDYVRELGFSLKTDSFVRQGQMTWLPSSAVLPGQPIELNSATGMVGLPQRTNFGITVRMLLNPSVGPGSVVKVNNSSIQTPQFVAGWAEAAGNMYLAGSVSKDDDGSYKVLAVDHTGDTRGQEWYTDAVCQTMNPVGAFMQPTQYYQPWPIG